MPRFRNCCLWLFVRRFARIGLPFHLQTSPDNFCRTIFPTNPRVVWVSFFCHIALELTNLPQRIWEGKRLKLWATHAHQQEHFLPQESPKHCAHSFPAEAFNEPDTRFSILYFPKRQKTLVLWSAFGAFEGSSLLPVLLTFCRYKLLYICTRRKECIDLHLCLILAWVSVMCRSNLHFICFPSRSMPINSKG